MTATIIRSRRLTALACAALVGLAGLIAPDASAQPAAPEGAAAVAPAAVPATVRGKIDAVTVYRGQALVTRTVDLAGPAGLAEVIVTDLPTEVVAASLFAEADGGIEIRSVRYRERPVSQDVRAEVQKIDTQIRTIQDTLQANAKNAQLQQEQKSYLTKLEAFAAPTANVELTKGVLNAETLRVLTTFIFDQRQKISTTELTLTREARDLNEQLQLLKRQRDEIAGGSSRTVREAVVFLNAQQAGGKLRVRYLVDNAAWTPSYNVRADKDRKKITLEYNASIQQMSGEDWGDVAMTLSTATPALVASAPTLEPLALALVGGQPGAGGQGQQVGGVALSGKYSEDRARLNQFKEQQEKNRNLVAGNGSIVINPGGNNNNNDGQSRAAAFGFNDELKKLDDDVNDASRGLQILELVARDAAKPRGERADPVRVNEVVPVTYVLAARTSLPSRADQQLIQVAAVPMKSDFAKVAMPVLTDYVYDQATVTNDGKVVLLAGPVASYVDGQFVGHGNIPTVAVGQNFTVGFGIDSSLRATRELVERTETMQGGNRVINFTYKLSVENFGTNPVPVRLLDRLPTGKENEVKITLAVPGKDLATEPSYLAGDRKKGILRWDLTIPAQAINEKALSFEYSFKVEYDKQMSIAGLPATR